MRLRPLALLLALASCTAPDWSALDADLAARRNAPPDVVCEMTDERTIACWQY